MSGYIEKLRKENEHFLDRMWLLFKIGVAKEQILIDRIDSLHDELLRIKAIAYDNTEIICIVDRAIKLDKQAAGSGEVK